MTSAQIEGVSKIYLGNSEIQKVYLGTSLIYELTSGLGPEIVLNGGFDDTSAWTNSAGLTISGGVLNINAGNYASARQNVTLTAGKSYEVTYTVSGYVSGSIRPYFSGGTTVTGTVRSSNGTFNDTLVAASGNNNIFISTINIGFVGTIDNVSMKEVL